MIRSMTGFGRCEIVENNRKFAVEIKSVNHRYLDINIRIPKALSPFEAAVRNELKAYITRGKVDVFISYEDLSEKTSVLHYNREVAEEYLKYLRQMAEEFRLDDDIRVSTLSRFPEIFTMKEADVDEEALWKELQKVVSGAARMFVDTRVAEGEHLKADLLAKMEGMQRLTDFISERFPRVMEEYRRKLEDKVRELLAGTAVDEGRLLTEVTIFADKICVDEEIVRLRSHIETARTSLQEGGPVGRKLDFIAQEMNREANTILSKANDLDTSNCCLDLKTEIEKVREQIQNIE
ncbi:YicC family protein [Acetatifactor muris]|uniref:YicC-like family, N-terminal region n=1 Tax=Acetatifactor muris TaxID=879566 RepID=A0A2K4ZLM5_9FIRM|nr:YicC/YloC family endoribonuclease [Acetatifactor muris]MCI8800312.1 YicC family protein [Lachnospiraceae bacterium]MCR2049903.1 YicC family protein [Acetatifactor muris]SOY31316.1 hypothetical protein AMURIS_04053 [Acetatifactor muris]